MPSNINPETGIAYGVIDARKVPDLWDAITQDGVNETEQEARRNVEKDLKFRFADFDAAIEFEGIDDGEKDEDEINDEKVDILSDWLTECILRATDLGGCGADEIAEEALDVIEIDSGTFDIQELIDAVMRALDDRDYFNFDQADCSFSYEDAGFQYRLGDLGGAPLIWVIKSPYVTPCKTCSPCVPNAGDLDNCTTEGQANNIAYCVEPDDIEDDDDKPFIVRRLSDNEIIYQRPEKEDE